MALLGRRRTALAVIAIAGVALLVVGSSTGASDARNAAER